MTARNVAAIVSTGLAVALLAGSSACTSFYEIPIETPIQPKMDVSMFQRVLIAGFIGGGTDDVDANLETVRLAAQPAAHEVFAARDRSRGPAARRHREGTGQRRSRPAAVPGRRRRWPAAGPQRRRHPRLTTRRASATKKTSNAIRASLRTSRSGRSWARNIRDRSSSPARCSSRRSRRLATSRSSASISTSSGAGASSSQRVYQERKGFTLQPKLIYIDGRTGATLYSETLREEILYNAQQNTPALSSYFELMDKLIPSFLNTLSTQKIRGTRMLVK